MFKFTLVLTIFLGICSVGTDLAAARAHQTFKPLEKAGIALRAAGTRALKGRKSASGGMLKLTVRPRVKVQLTQAAVRSLTLVGFEYELLFHHAGRATYYLRTFVHPGRKRVVLMSLSGRIPAGGKTYVKGASPSRFIGGFLYGFHLAAKWLLNSTRTADCRNMAVIDARAASRLGIKGRLASRFLRDRSRALKRRAKVCRELAAVRNHKMTIRIDDVAYLAKDRRGRIVGLVKADLRWRGRRKLELNLNGFRALKP